MSDKLPVEELKLDVDQAGEIKAAFRRERGSNGSQWTNEKIKALTERKGLFGGVLDVLEGRATIVLQPEPEKNPEPVLDTFILVNRSIRPTYPDFVKKEYVDAPEFIRIERTGPAEYSLDSLFLSLHPKQEQGRVATGHEVWEYQKKLGIEGCVSLADLLEIQKKGIVAFRKFFGGKAVFGWKSVVQDADGSLFVPYLIGRGDQVVVHWDWLDDDWFDSSPALRFAS